VVVVADESLEAAGHGDVVKGQHFSGARAELHGDAGTMDEDVRFAAGRGGGIGDTARELGRGTEVIELVGL
jgi:hypothetical protein